MDGFISSNDTTIIKSDPTPKYQTQVIQVLKDLNGNLLPNNESFFLKCMNPKAPILYGLPKIHKPDIPLRPIASYTNAPA